MILKNILLFIKKYTIIFVLLLITQLVAVVVIIFSYGVYMNNQYNLAASDSDELDYKIFFIEDDEGNSFVEMSEVVANFPEVFEDVEDIISTANLRSVGRLEEGIAIDGKKTKNLDLYSEFRLVEGKYIEGKFSNSSYTGYIEGEWFTPEDYNSGKNKIIIPYDMYVVNDEKWEISGEEYTVIAYESADNMFSPFSDNEIVIPLEALSDDMQPKRLWIQFERPLTRMEYENFFGKMEEIFGPGKLQYDDFFVVDVDDEKVMKTMTMTSVIMAVVSSLAVCLIYRYLLSERIKTTAIYRICGSTSFDAVKNYVCEMVINLFVTTVIGVLLFKYELEPLLESRYEWFNQIYSGNQYLVLVAIYLIIIVITNIVTIFAHVRKSPAQMLRALLK